MDNDYGTQDTYESNSYSYDTSGQDNTYESDRNYNFTSSKDNDYSPTIEQTNHGTSSDTKEIAENDDVTKQSPELEPREITSQDENSKESALENLDLENDVKRDEGLLDTNQEPFLNDNNLEHTNESQDDNIDCCSCSNPVTCLAIFCDCFGL